MTLIPNAKDVLTRSYSVWMGSYLPLVALGLPEILFYTMSLEISPVLAWLLALVLAALMPILRVIDQGIAAQGATQ